MGKQEGKKLTKKRPPQAPPKEGMWEDTVGYGGSLSLELQPPQAPPKEGMYLAGYGMLGVGGRKGWKIGIKGYLFIRNSRKLGIQTTALSHLNHRIVNL